LSPSCERPVAVDRDDGVAVPSRVAPPLLGRLTDRAGAIRVGQGTEHGHVDRVDVPLAPQLDVERVVAQHRSIARSDAALQVEIPRVEQQIEHPRHPPCLRFGVRDHPLAAFVLEHSRAPRLGFPDFLALGLGIDDDGLSHPRDTQLEVGVPVARRAEGGPSGSHDKSGATDCRGEGPHQAPGA